MEELAKESDVIEEDSFSYKLLSLLAAGFPLDEPYVERLIKGYQKKILTQLSQKQRFLVPDSAVVYGVPDITGQLEPNQVYLNLTGQGIQIGKVVIMKNPCIHPGDVRQCEAVFVAGLRHIENAIVFSVKGERPVADQIAGSDLDGDKFFVSWDKTLNKLDIVPPMEFPRYDIKTKDFGKFNLYNDLGDFFVEYCWNRGSLLGLISNYHFALCETKPDGPKNRLCLELCKLQSRAVDAAKTNDNVPSPQSVLGGQSIRYWPVCMKPTFDKSDRKKLRENKPIYNREYKETKGPCGQIWKAMQDKVKEFDVPKPDRRDPCEAVQQKLISRDGRKLYRDQVKQFIAKFRSENKGTEYPRELFASYRQQFLDMKLSFESRLDFATAVYEETYLNQFGSKDFEHKHLGFPWEIFLEELCFIYKSDYKNKIPLVSDHEIIAYLLRPKWKRK
eukprot:TRINITY_DN3706_c0_g1_i1.p2 TRINITY_DN3706_c0_g1~~TRINITY_DN3706_c0_g1_i1.p2  ORF type:complete len:446 (+),score=92.80 TRINITY_DN3706_c0_g1_i1:1842-3179(+)